MRRGEARRAVAVMRDLLDLFSIATLSCRYSDCRIGFEMDQWHKFDDLANSLRSSRYDVDI